MYYLRSVYAMRSLCAALVDSSCLAIAFALPWFFLHPPIPGGTYLGIVAAMAVLMGAALFFNDAYRPDSLGRGYKTTRSILSTMGLGLAFALVLYFAIPVPKGFVPTMAWVGGIFFPLMFLARAGLRLALGMPLLTQHVVIIGATDLGHRIASVLHQYRETGIGVLGFLSDDIDLPKHGAQFHGFPVIGRVEQLEKILADRKVDFVVVASKERNEYFPEDTLMRAKTRGTKIESGISFLERLSGRIYMRDLRPSYLIFGSGFRRGWFYRASQRTLDIVGSVVLLALSLPVLSLAAIAIKLESPGPVLFRQRRLGMDDKPFMMNKLRSMRDGAESRSGAVFTSDDDDRITSVGYFLRRTRLDELPQLWNVLRGEISLVGPRAERPEFVEMLSERYCYYRYRTSVRPGITGWAQTRYGYVNNVEAYEEKLALDLYYLKYRSLFMDLTILAQTVKTVLHFRGM